MVIANIYASRPVHVRRKYAISGSIKQSPREWLKLLWGVYGVPP